MTEKGLTLSWCAGWGAPEGRAERWGGKKKISMIRCAPQTSLLGLYVEFGEGFKKADYYFLLNPYHTYMYVTTKLRD